MMALRRSTSMAATTVSSTLMVAGDHPAVVQVLAALVLLDVGHHEAAVAHE